MAHVPHVQVPEKKDLLAYLKSEYGGDKKPFSQLPWVKAVYCTFDIHTDGGPMLLLNPNEKDICLRLRLVDACCSSPDSLLFAVVDVPFAVFPTLAKMAGKGPNIPVKIASLSPTTLTCATVISSAGEAVPGFPRVVLVIEWGLVNMQTSLREPIQWAMPPRQEGLQQYLQVFISQVQQVCSKSWCPCMIPPQVNRLLTPFFSQDTWNPAEQSEAPITYAHAAAPTVRQGFELPPYTDLLSCIFDLILAV